MEDLFKRAPMVNRLILKNLDNLSIANLKNPAEESIKFWKMRESIGSEL